MLDYIVGDAKGMYSAEDLTLLRRAYEFAREAHEGQVRDSGEPYIMHPVEVARILAERRLDAESLAAAILHDTIEDCGVPYEELVKRFGQSVADLVQALTKITVLKDASRRKDKREEQVENQRKMILAMANDIRIIIIKLADRLHNIRTLGALPPHRQAKVSRETLDVYAPLANRLGMMLIRSELEDGCMMHLYPEEYEDLAHRVRARSEEREKDVQKSVEILKRELDRHGIRAEVFGRPKHIYSIRQKMLKHGLPFEEIHDLIGLRVICGTPDQGDKTKEQTQAEIDTCYKILGVIHNLWTPIDGRIKDYIGRPKENGYQSLHTTVVGLEGKKLEIQIRTVDMHKFAEEGVAAHWKYKEGKRGKQDLDDKLKWLRKLTGWLNDVRDPGEFKEALKNDVFSDTIFCFTPHGDVIELPAGSTPVDFAYCIHTNVGDTCVGARVNKKNVPLRHELQNGDFVQIMTHKTGHPSASWLDFVKTSRARTKIKHWLRLQNLQENVEKGRDLLIKSLRAKGLPTDWHLVEEKLKGVLKGFEMPTPEALLAEVGFGSIPPGTVVSRAFPAPEEDGTLPTGSAPRKRPPRATRSSPGVVVHGIPSTRINFARCCSPVPGDPIIGYVTSKSRTVNIHQQGCASLEKSLAASSGEGQLLEVEWGEGSPTRKVKIQIECRDYTGLLAAVSSTITSNNISIVGSQTKTFESRSREKAPKAILTFTVKVSHLDQLNQLLKNIEKMENVTGVKRVCRVPRGGSRSAESRENRDNLAVSG